MNLWRLLHLLPILRDWLTSWSSLIGISKALEDVQCDQIHCEYQQQDSLCSFIAELNANPFLNEFLMFVTYRDILVGDLHELINWVHMIERQVTISSMKGFNWKFFICLMLDSNLDMNECTYLTGISAYYITCSGSSRWTVMGYYWDIFIVKNNTYLLWNISFLLFINAALIYIDLLLI